MSVLFLMPNWNVPSEAWLERMIQGLGNDITSIVCLDTNGDNAWQNRVRAVSLRPNLRFQKYIKELFRILGVSQSKYENFILDREIRRREVKSVLCHYGEFATRFMQVWKNTTIPLFVHFHGYDATFDIRKDDQPSIKHFSDAYQKNILELSERALFIANSNFTKSLLVSAGVPENKVTVNYLGVALPPEHRIHTDRKPIRILHLGRLVDFKSPDRTIRAFEMVRASGIDSELIIAGDGPLRITCELLRIRSPYKNSIYLLGAVNVEQAQSLLLSADIYTQHNIQGEISKQSECLGVSIIEAMAAGLPIVATKHGGVLETVVDRSTGFLVTPGDCEAQANAIIELAKDPQLRQEFGDAGRIRVSEKFNLDNEIKTLREIMRL